MSLVFTLWFYLTPVIYPPEAVSGKVRMLTRLNPLSVLINGLRRAVFGGGGLNFSSLGLAFLLSLLVLFLGYFVFKKSEGVFADVV